MFKALDNLVCVDKDILNQALLIIGDSSDRSIENNGSNYLLSESELSDIRKKLDKIIETKKRSMPKDLSFVDTTDYEKLNDEYLGMRFDPIRNSSSKITSKKIDKEKQLSVIIRFNDKINELNEIPRLIEEIKEEIKEIKRNDLSENITALSVRFYTLYREVGKLEEYKKLKTELDSIIRKSYVDSINNNPYDNKGIFLVKEGDNVRIMSSDNMDSFTCGYIYSPSSIKCVKNTNSDAFISFSSIVDDSYEILLNDEKPIGVYAITYGEGSINPNYKKAQSIYSVYGIPFIEIDKTKFMEPDRINIKGLIDNLLDDMGTPVRNKNEDFYNKFQFFYDKFKILKSEKYDEGRIINLFDFSHNMIFSQRWMDPNHLLDDRLGIDRIKEIFDNNIYLDFNIFRSKEIDIDQLETFERIFYDKKDDRVLNMVYVGINDILEEIHNASDERKREIVNIINSSKSKDSYLLKQLLKPSYKHIRKIHKTDQASEVVDFARLNDEREKINSLLSLLKSSDGYSR